MGKGFFSHGVGFNFSGPAGNHGNTQTALVQVALDSLEWAGTAEEGRVVAAFLMRAIIAGEQDERVLVQFVFLQLGHDLADSGVEPGNHGGLVALRARPFFAAVREVCGNFHSVAGLLGKLVVRVRGSVG